MTPRSLIDRFFAEECTAHVRESLLNEIDVRSTGSRYFTFNAFNVLLDVDGRRATIEDELDVEAGCIVPIDEFEARLRNA